MLDGGGIHDLHRTELPAGTEGLGRCGDADDGNTQHKQHKLNIKRTNWLDNVYFYK